jgi:hypothetical protein
MSASSNRPIFAPILDFGTLVILSTISRQTASSPLRSFGSMARRHRHRKQAGDSDSDWMQNTVRFENTKRLDERLAGVKPPPFARVPHPVDIELIWPHAIDSGESRVELLAAIVFHARPVALDEAVSTSCPGAADIDHVIPFGRSDLGQEPRFQDVTDERLAGRDDCLFFPLVGPGQPSGTRRDDPLFPLGHGLDPPLRC